MHFAMPQASVQNPFRLWHNDGEMLERKPKLPPLDTAALDRLALRYVERFATTRARLVQYLVRKIRERGWEGAAADPSQLAERLADLGYIDDRSFAEARARSMTRRGLGMRRVADALRHAGVDDDDKAAITPEIEEQAVDAALVFARRRRIGPFANEAADRDLRQRQLAQMLRAGHGFDLARQIIKMAPGEDVSVLPGKE
jgi:regulatory protein